MTNLCPLHCLLSWQWGHPSDHGQVGIMNCFLLFGSRRITDCDLSRKSSVVVLMRQWKGHPNSRSKFALARIWIWTIISPTPKSKAIFLNTLMVVSTFALANDIFIIWSNHIGSPNSSQICFSITTISNPESSTSLRSHPELPNLASIAWSRRLWCATTRPSSFLRIRFLYSQSTADGSCLDSSLT